VTPVNETGQKGNWCAYGGGFEGRVRVSVVSCWEYLFSNNVRGKEGFRKGGGASCQEGGKVFAEKIVSKGFSVNC